jgi:hypothetical protein
MTNKFPLLLVKMGLLRERVPELTVSQALPVVHPFEIHRDSVFAGDLHCTCDVMVYGEFIGSITAPGFSVTLCAGSTSTDLVVRSKALRIKGDVRGLDADVDAFFFDGAMGSLEPSQQAPAKVVYSTLSLVDGTNFSAVLQRRRDLVPV